MHLFLSFFVNIISSIFLPLASSSCRLPFHFYNPSLSSLSSFLFPFIFHPPPPLLHPHPSSTPYPFTSPSATLLLPTTTKTIKKTQEEEEEKEEEEEDCFKSESWVLLFYKGKYSHASSFINSRVKIVYSS